MDRLLQRAIALLICTICIALIGIGVVGAEGPGDLEPAPHVVPQPLAFGEPQPTVEPNSLPTPSPDSTPKSTIEPQTNASSCVGGISASDIDSYLQCYGSPMAGTGSSFERWGRQYNVDPRLMVAIAGAETSFGKHLCSAYNAFNWFYSGWCTSPFSSWDEAIKVTTRGMGGSYLQAGQNTIYSFTFGCGNHCYCPNCQDWYNNVTRFYAEQGGDPNTDDLTYVGNSGAGSVTVNSVQTYDDSGVSSNFSPGESITYGVNLSYSGSSTASAHFTWEATGPRQIMYWSGNLDVYPGLTGYELPASIPTDAPSGTYTFRVTSNFNGQASSKSTTFSVSGGGSTTCPSSQYRAEYYNNSFLSGSANYIRCEDWPISHYWEYGDPGGGVGNDNFSVRWTGRAYIDEGAYTFVGWTDDGMRVWIDNNLIIDAWWDQGPTEYRVTRSISSGMHDIKVEYYEHTGYSLARFWWEQQTGNLALGKPAFASSVERDDWDSFGPRNVTDGNLNTRWSSRQQYEGGQRVEWIWVTLEGWYNVDKVVLHWEDAYAYRYNIQVWDGPSEAWVTAYQKFGGQGGVETIMFSPRYTCCVKMEGMIKANPSWGYSLREFEVYGSGTATTFTVDSSSGEVCPDVAGPVGVGIEDIQAVASLWRQPAPSPYDSDDDGIITVKDIMIMNQRWGEVCSYEGARCEPDWTLACDDSDSWNNSYGGSTNLVSVYSCTTWDESGPEYTYEFTASASGPVEVSLSDLSADLDLFVLDSTCDGSECLAFGDTTVSFDAVADRTYYIVVDGYQGAVSNYTIGVSCPAGTQDLENQAPDKSRQLFNPAQTRVPEVATPTDTVDPTKQ